jgi:uncharacterized protein (DUF2267 family)
LGDFLVASALRIGPRSDVRPVDPDAAIAAVFGVLSRHVSEGQVVKVRNALPKDIRQSWENARTREPATADA